MLNSLQLCSFFFVLLSYSIDIVSSFIVSSNKLPFKHFSNPKDVQYPITKTSIYSQAQTKNPEEKVFENFVTLLQQKQQEIIATLEELDGESNEKFSCDAWGSMMEKNDDNSSDTVPTATATASGGRTRVMQNGTIIEKGAVSMTCIRNGILTSERAKSIQDRSINSNIFTVKEGDTYSAAALSLVLHSRSPMVPTFRSDVRLFLVKSKDDPNQIALWFGGGADLTPYYLFENDIIDFHNQYYDLCTRYHMDYDIMKKCCDDYFYLPARDEHRGTGGIFFDNLISSSDSYAFVQNLIDLWMPSWIPIINKRKDISFTEQERYWQLVRRGRYLEFNLLYDRGVRFGLVGKNPRVEGVMVSAPPLIAWEYNYKIEEGSEEEKMMKVLKLPIDWVKNTKSE